MPESDRPRILLVDDDPLALEGLARQLHARFDVTLASGGKEALRLIMSQGPFEVVVADLRMPEMDGIALLYCLRMAAPDTVRILLTGHADVDAAAAAVNEGNVFRFLTKPCPPAKLHRALEASVEQYRRATADRRPNQPAIGMEGQHVRENSPC